MSNLDSSPINQEDLTEMQIQGNILLRYSGQNAVVTVPDGIEKLGDWAFSDTEERTKRRCSFIFPEVKRTLEKVVFPPSLRVIGKGAFHDEVHLKSVVFSDGLEEIGELAFAHCISLSEVKLPDSIKIISSSAFRGNKALISVVIPCAVSGYVAPRIVAENCISANLFSNCLALQRVTIPEGTVTIGKEAFSQCSALSEIAIPDSVEEIGDRAFEWCVSLHDFFVPRGVKSIGREALPHGEHSKMEKIDVSPENEAFCSVEGVLYTKDRKLLLACPAGYEKTVFTVPDGVEEIAPSAFEGCKKIKKIVLPNSVLRIGERAFSRMYHLQKAILPAHLQEIEDEVFAYCTKLNNLTWPTDLQKIGIGAFRHTGFEKINIPDGVKTIGDYAFETRNLNSHVFYGSARAKPVIADKVTVPKSVEEIGISAFSGIKDIEVFDTIEPNAKPAEEYIDNINGSSNGKLGLAGIWHLEGYTVGACNSEWSDHVITVRSGEDGAVKCRVRMPAEQKRKVYCTYASSWGKNGEFNFNAIDRIFDELTPDAKLSYAMDRLLCQKNISEAFLDQLIEFLKKRAKRAITRALEGDSPLDLACLAKYGIAKKSSTPSYIKTANELKAAQCEEWLLAWNNEES